jgi:hypothetical protein
MYYVNKQIEGVWKMMTKQRQTKAALESMLQFAYWKNI